MINTNTKLILIVMLLLLVVSGCGKNTEPAANIENTTLQSKNSDKTVTIAYICAGQTSPQPLINIKYPIFAEELKKMDKDIEFVPTSSLSNIWPMMDKEKDSPDFVYLPVGNFGTYVTEKSRFGGSDKYVLIAGSMNYNGTFLIAGPGINTLKDLDGKKVGIANLRYVDEYQLNKVLNTVGLATEASGGTVKIGWDDIVTKTIENFKKGQYDAICLYALENHRDIFDKVHGSKILNDLNPDGLFGEKAPRYWLVARKDLVKDNPELVKVILRGHVLSTEKAIKEFDKLPALARDTRLSFYKDKTEDMEKFLEINTLERYKKRWQEVEGTYDPNTKYAQEIFNFLDEKGLLKDKTAHDFIELKPLQEVLKEMGRPELK